MFIEDKSVLVYDLLEKRKMHTLALKNKACVKRLFYKDNFKFDKKLGNLYYQ